MFKIPDLIDAGGGPITLVFSKTGRAFFSERLTGNLWEILGQEDFRLVHHFPILQITGHHETGLLGITLDRDFETNGYIYCFYTIGGDITTATNRVVKIKDGEVESETILIENLPAHHIHNGGILTVGPDNKLYIGVGINNSVMEKSQDKDYLGGKILRINLDGTIPDDNPFPNSPVYSYGHRNIFGLSFDETKNLLYACDVGPDKNDEINIIEKGGNYGWPDVTGAVKDPKYIDPIVTYTPTITNTQCVFYDDALYFGAYNEGTVHKLSFDESGRKVIKDTIVYQGKPFGVVGVFVDRSGSFYVATTNRILNFEPTK